MNFESSLPFGGGPAYIAVFWITFALWQGAEMILNARQRSGSPSRRHDRGSFRLLFVVLGVAFSLDFGFALLAPSLAIASAARPCFVAGICCVIAGTALRWWAIATLGRYFTVDVVTHTAQPVINSGPYRRIRHPAYAGLLLALFGFGLALGNWAGLLAMMVLSGGAFGYRIAVEEAALRASLGDAYARYMSRTWRLIPCIL